MITKRTVLVLGAGASIPFGFPSGFRLFQRIAASGGLDGSNHLVQELVIAGAQEAEAIELIRALRYSGKTSVDAFLEHRADLRAVGKLAIALALIPCEEGTHVFHRPDGPHLYDHVFAGLNAAPEHFRGNPLTVVTFNYDRSFEHYLTTALLNTYNLSAADAATLAKLVPVIHLHGRLAAYAPFGDGGRDYETDVRHGRAQLAAQSLKIIHEATPDDPGFRAAWEGLSEAEAIYILGFGYDRTNMTRLFAKANIRINAVFGSTFGLTTTECRTAERNFGRAIVLDPQFRDGLSYLRDCPPLDGPSGA